jgi:proteasome lid subunit RPN8/RPN11
MFIHREVVRAIVDHARRDAPDECCGLLLGRQGTIDEAVEAANLNRSPTAYLIDPAAQVAAIRRVRASGRAILGAYHSHPRSAPVPSPTDVAEARDAELVHVIVSLVPPDPEIRGYLIENGNFTEVPLVTLPEPPSSA